MIRRNKTARYSTLMSWMSNYIPHKTMGLIVTSIFLIRHKTMLTEGTQAVDKAC